VKKIMMGFMTLKESLFTKKKLVFSQAQILMVYLVWTVHFHSILVT